MERLSRWSGLALLAACPLIVISAFLHPSRETTTSIIASESRLVFAHTLFTLHGLLVLLGLPGFYQAQRGSMGRLGTAGYLGAFFGTYLIAVSGSFGDLDCRVSGRCAGQRKMPESTPPTPSSRRSPLDYGNAA
jgi:hypothetical protein